MAATTIPTTGKQIPVTLRALELQIDALTEAPLNELPHPARAILRSVANLLIAARQVVEDAAYARENP